MSYKVKHEDLKGDIKDFPIEVVQKMVDEQVRQGNKADAKVFQKANWTGFDIGGFSWANSIDGFGFWINVINSGKFDLFFSKYPKQSDLKEDNSKADKVVVNEKKVVKRTFRKLSEVKLLVTNRNRKAVIAFLDSVCEKKDLNTVFEQYDAWLSFKNENINSWICLNTHYFDLKSRETVKLRDIKRIHSREENRKQRELEKTKLFCETIEENASCSESEVKKIEGIPTIKANFTQSETKHKLIKSIDLLDENEELKKENEKLSNELNEMKSFLSLYNDAIKAIESNLKQKSDAIIKLRTKIENQTDFSNDLIEERNGLYDTITKLDKTNEELSKMINGKIEVLGKREKQVCELDIENAELKVANNKLRDYNDVLENKVGKEKLFRNIFILMFLISFITLVATNLRY